MEIKTVSIDQVSLWDKNPRNIKTKDFERLKKQITELGVYKPLIACKENGGYTILGGNMRLRALRDLGIKEVEISVVTPKDEAEKIKIALSDNDRAGEYEEDKLAELVYPHIEEISLYDYKVDLGKSVALLDLVEAFAPNLDGEEDVLPEIDDAPAITQIGDLFMLGKHRLLCGDSTNPESYKALLGDNLADMVFTDPPYNVAYEGAKFGPIMGDDMSEEKFVDFVLQFIARMKESTKKGGVFYICSGYSSYSIFVYGLKKAGLVYSGPIIWVKNNTSLGWNDYHHKHEMILKAKRGKKTAQPILYGWNGGKHYFVDSRFEADVWEIKRRASQTMCHPTQKPLALAQRAIRNSSKLGEIVLDPFGGSGSTLIAAEREDRTANVIELDPKYCDVIIRRYAALGGEGEKEIRASKKEIKIPELTT